MVDIASALAGRLVPTRPPVAIVLGQAVAASTGAQLTVRIDGQAVSAWRARSYSPTVGDIVLCLRSSGTIYAICALNAAALETLDVPPVPQDVAQPLPVSYRPVATGSWYDGAWQSSDLVAGAVSSGRQSVAGAWYGGEPQAIADPAGGSVYVVRIPGRGAPGQVSVVGTLLAGDDRPMVGPTIMDVATLGVLSGSGAAHLPIPTSWVRALCAGEAGGVGLGDGSPDTSQLWAYGKDNFTTAMLLTIERKYPDA